MSRLTLGEIGNRVSAITIDISIGGAIRKEILQPTDSILTRACSVKLKHNPSSVSINTIRDLDVQHDQKQSQQTFQSDVSFVFFICN